MKILFKIFPQKSHLNATFPFARALQRAGHEVIYAGVLPLRNHVEAQGYAYHTEAEDIFPYQEPTRNSPRLTVWTMMRNCRKIKAGSKILRQRIQARPDIFSPLVRALKPQVILVDSPYALYALALRRHGIPFALLESMMRLDRSPGCPPLDTDYVPGKTRWNRFRCWLHWQRYGVKKKAFSKIGVRFDLHRKGVAQYASWLKIEPKQIAYDRYFHLGLRDRPELILSPRSLDFPRALKSNQFYVGTSVDLARNEVASDYRFSELFDRLVAARSQGTPIIYCSLGTANWRYVGAERFLARVAQAARGQPWNLLLVIGNEFSLQAFSGLPANVHVFQLVPQLQVLRQCDLMITHGGMNSIAECVLLGVPMLVYPGTKEIDQAGNAARVVFHRAGLKGKLSTETTAGLLRKIKQILNNKRYHKNLTTLRDQLLADRIDPESAHALIQKVVTYGGALIPEVAGMALA